MQKDIFENLDQFEIEELTCSEVQDFFQQYPESDQSPSELKLALAFKHLLGCPGCMQKIGKIMGDDYSEKIFKRLKRKLEENGSESK